MIHTGIRTMAAILAFAIPVALSGCAKKTGTPTGKVSYVFTSVSRGSVEKTVSSSGSLAAVSEVSVLAQMSGTAEKVNADYNDHIRKGQILVELNTDMLKLQKEEKVAAVSKARAAHELQALNYRNQQKLAEKQLVSDYDLKSAKMTLDSASAELASAEAALKVIETEINQYAFIKSPIDGIVLARNVSVGQNVVEGSSSNSSSLFTLAEDLDEMEIEAAVDELDIASIKTGQGVRFSVEALPGKTFTGKVESIHLLPTTSNNVVSYDVIVKVDNSSGSLLPGMTAEVEFIEKSSDNVLLVPNAALRYEPSVLTADEMAKKVFEASLIGLSEDERNAAIERHDGADSPPPADVSGVTAKKATGLSSLVMGGGPGGRGPGGPGWKKPNGKNAKADTAAKAATEAGTVRNLWFIDDSGELSVVRVKAGVSDGTNTEVSSDQDIEGLKVILKEKV